MYLDRKQIKSNARQALDNNYWNMIGYTVLVAIIEAAISGLSYFLIGTIAIIIVYPVIVIGLANLCYRVYCGYWVQTGNLFDGFKRYGHVLGGYWWMTLFTVLWTCLFIVPGIIKSIAYSMTPYILMDQPEVDATDALSLSIEMTRGHKMEIFVMYLSFIGWWILTILTCGIIWIFYVGPYFQLTMAGYYESLKREHCAKNNQTFNNN